MNSKLYIRNLSYSTTESDLGTLFASSGNVVLVDIIKDPVTHRSKGYGFIQMSNPVEAENAVEMFNGWNLDNCQLRVGLTSRGEVRGGSRDFGAKRSDRSLLRRSYLRYT